MRKVSEEIGQETLAAWKKGDTRAFEKIVRLTMNRAVSMALGLLGNEEDAKDISQEAFVAAHRARDTLGEGRPGFPWFYRILRNRCLNFLRSRKRRAEVSIDILVERESPVESPDRRVSRREDAKALSEALFRLTEEHREVVILRSFNDLSYREIAEALGISEGTVMSRLFYARKALCAHLKDPLRREGDDRR